MRIRSLIRLTILVTLGLLSSSGAFAGQRHPTAIWIKGLGISVIHDSAIYAAPSKKGRVLRTAHRNEILTSVGRAPKGWFKVYCPQNTRGYIRAVDVEKQWERDGHGHLTDAWVGYHDALSDYYQYEIENPAHADEGEPEPLLVAHYFDPETYVGLDDESIIMMGPLAMQYVLGKLGTDAFAGLPPKEAAADHRKALGLLASYGPLARSGLLFLLDSDNWRDHLHAAEAMAVVTERLTLAERKDPRAISGWFPGMGGLGEVMQPGMYMIGRSPRLRGIPENQGTEEMRAHILKDPVLARKVYAALTKFYAIGRSKELIARMKALLHASQAAVRQAAAKALEPLGLSGR